MLILLYTNFTQLLYTNFTKEDKPAGATDMGEMRIFVER